MAANIKRSRASVSRDDIKNYFDHLRTTLQDIPPSNVFNYDETNVQDDPGKKKMLFRRGTKYPERVCNFTKSATTIMMCGSASGMLLPPYIIYKSERMWLQWTENGPKGSPCCNKRCCALGARYNRTEHGWMDAQTFTDWFTSAFLPHAKELEGRKVLLGDNLSSHFTNEVLQLCRENNIDFVCLPKNSTHLTQPLDVGFFRAFKTAWRSTLSKWKHDHSSSTTVDKKDFPHLLDNTLNEMDKKSDDGSSAIRRHVISSFRATGIVPLDPERVLHKLPDIPVDENIVHNVLVNYLQEKRFGSSSSRRNIKRQKLDVQPGKSITGPESSSDEEQEIAAVLEESSDDGVSEQLEEETEYFSVENDDLTIGTYLLVDVVGMKSVESTKTRFKTVENDIFMINASEVVAVLPNPDIVDTGGENIYMFKKNVDIKEI
nr:unnamed protein product [Callosobruchus chinensis]